MMKPMTKKEFTKECFKAIASMNDEEIEAVRKGFYTLFKVLEEGKAIGPFNLNSNSVFLLDVTFRASTEAMKRMKKNEMPY